MERITSGAAVPRGPVLSHDEALALIARAQAGDAGARDALVEANLRLVASVVRRFHGRGADPDDLFQVGCIGLIKAIEKFDLSLGVAFSTYAVPRIIGELRRYLRDDRPIKVGRSLWESGQAALAARDELEQRLGRPPTAAEIAEEVGLDPEAVLVAIEAAGRPASLDQPVDLGDGSPVFLKDQVAGEDDAEKPVVSLALSQVLAKLPGEERRLVHFRFVRGWSQVRTAKAMGCSQAHVSRMERRAVERLRRLWLG